TVRPDIGAHVARREIGSGLEAERGNLRARHAAPQVGELVVGVDDGRRAGFETRDHLALGARRALETAEAFEVLRTGIRDETYGRPRDLHERRELTRMIRAHLDHGIAMLRFEPEERERHADVIVEVAARREARAGLRQDRRRHLLDGRLPVAARDTDERIAVRLAPAIGGTLE